MEVLPGLTAQAAGEAAWLTGLLAFFPFLLLYWLLASLLRGERGLAAAYRDSLGRWLGKGVSILYMVWGIYLMAAEGRLYAERLLAAGYRSAPPAVFTAILLGVLLWVGRKKLAGFARAAEICYLALALAVALVLAFSILGATPEYVLPVWFSDLPAAAAATLIPVGALSCGVYGAFLTGRVIPREGDRRRGALWLAAGCGALALLQFGVLAQLGAGLSGQLDAPFFEVARGVGVQGAFQRVEAVVIAVWIFSDFILLGLLLFAIREAGRETFGEKWGRRCVPIALLLAFLVGLFLFPDDFSAKRAARTAIPTGNLILAFLLPGLALLCKTVKRQRRR